MYEVGDGSTLWELGENLLFIVESCSLELMVYSEKSLGVFREIGFFYVKSHLDFVELLATCKFDVKFSIFIAIIVLNMIDCSIIG